MVVTLAQLNDISYQIIGCALRVHTEVGSGLFESVYDNLMCDELRLIGLQVERQRAVPMTSKTRHFDKAFRADLIVENLVIIEVKSAEGLGPTDIKQVLTYLRVLDMKLGLVLNFGTASLGIRRVINNHPPHLRNPK